MPRDNVHQNRVRPSLLPLFGIARSVPHLRGLTWSKLKVTLSIPKILAKAYLLLITPTYLAMEVPTHSESILDVMKGQGTQSQELLQQQLSQIHATLEFILSQEWVSKISFKYYN